MAGKQRPDGHRIHVNVKLSDDEAAVIDAVRGTLERGPWMREAALSVARQDSGIPAQDPVKPGRELAGARVKAPVPPVADLLPRTPAGTAVFAEPGGVPVVTAPVPAAPPRRSGHSLNCKCLMCKPAVKKS